MKLNAYIKRMSFWAIVLCFIFISMAVGCRKSAPKSTPPVDAVKPEDIQASKSLSEIISRRSGWDPILAQFYDKAVPDFTVKDINGKSHSLSDYRGKEVMVVLWATWCMPCMQEVPHINALRDIMHDSKLAILAISNEPLELVKATAADKNMTYTVISYKGVLPEPFNAARGYPSAFFIRPDGTLKIVTEGSLHLGEMKSIVLAD